MKIAVMHSGNAGFFPRFYKALYNAIEQNGDECVLVVPNCGRNKRCVLPRQITYGTRLNWFVHSRLYKLTGLQDIFSIFETLHLFKVLRKLQPDLLHFHLINDKCLNMPLLVKYINRHKIPVVWTMHDCRAFTGQCPYFDEVNCDRWKTGCGSCPQCETWIDNTHREWQIRRRWHTAIDNLTIVTPSQWLADFVNQSFFKGENVKVIYNGVDTSGFSKHVDIDVRKKYGIPKEKKIVLGCAINWESRKGLPYFVSLATMLPSGYQIVLVGGIEDEKKQELSNHGIICTGRISTFEEMVAWYQSASVFCNPTLADNFPTTNIEALAAGTPIVTFRTGGSPEAIDEQTGIVVEQGNVEQLYEATKRVVEHHNQYSSQDCKTRSQLFSNDQYKRYVELYHSLR